MTRTRHGHENACLLKALIALTVVTGGCRAAIPKLGPDLPAARVTADGVFGGIATRFDRVFREPKVRISRRLITRNLLTPSRVFGDTATWISSPNNSTRITGWRGMIEPDRYHFTTDTSTAPLLRAGESKHTFRLSKRGDDQFEWLEDADFGFGNTTPAALAGAFTGWIAAGERADTAATRAELHSLFPHATLEWGRMFSVASFSTTRDAGGAWTQRHTIVLHTERAKLTYPAFAKWMHGYVSPLRVHMRLHDSTHTWLDVVVRNDSLVINLRSRIGELLPLEGGTAALPDTVQLDTDLSAKFSIFRVGFNALRAQFVFVHQPTERGWSLRFTREPDWQLPLLTEQMLRTPLRYPFENSGAAFRITARRASGDAQTFLNRRIQLPVEESTILRFVSRLAQGGVSDYIEGADHDLNLFLAAAFGALRDDTRSVIAILEAQTPPR